MKFVKISALLAALIFTFAACGKDNPNCLYLKMGALLDSCIDFFSKACYNEENGGLDDEFM